MERVYLLLILVLYVAILPAESSSNEACCQRLIDYVNHQKFDYAHRLLKDSADFLLGMKYDQWEQFNVENVQSLIKYYHDSDLKLLGEKGLKLYATIIYKADLKSEMPTSIKETIEIEKCRIALALYSEGSDEYIETLYWLALYYANENNLSDKGEAVYQQIVELCKRYGKDNTKSYADMMYAMSMMYFKKGDYPKADYYIEIAKQVNERNGISNVEILEFSHDIASVLNNIDKEESELIERCMDLQKHLGETYSPWTDWFIELANFALAEGDKDLYDDCMNSAKESTVTAYEKHYYDYIGASIDLFKYYAEHRRDEQAAQMGRSIEEMIDTAKLTLDATMSSCLIQMAKNFMVIGLCEESERLLNRADTILTFQRLSESVIYSDETCLQNPYAYSYYDLYEAFGDTYLIEKQYLKAEQYYLMALEKEEQLKRSTPTCWKKLARLYHLMGNNELALYYGMLGKDYYLLANSAESQNDLKQAEVYWLKYVDEFKQYYGDMHPVYATSLLALADFYYRHWRLTEAINLYDKVLNIRRKEYISATNCLTEEQRAYFWLQYQSEILSVYPTACSQMYQTEKLYNLQLLTKSLLLTSTNLITMSIMNSRDSTLKADYQYLKTLQNEIERMETIGVSANIAKREAEVLEKSIVSRSSLYRSVDELTSITWNDVREALPADAIAVEFFETGRSDGKVYEMLIIHKDFKYPILSLNCWIYENDLKEILTQYPKQIYSYGEISKKLYQQLCVSIFESLNSHIRNRIKKVYISPIGLLNQIAFEAIPINEKKRFSDKYEVIRLTSTREIVLNNQNKNSKPQCATIYGGIQYDVSRADLSAESAKYPEIFAHRNRVIENDSIDRGTIKYLSGTEKEAEMINKLLNEHDVSSMLFTAKAANEESFKNLSGKHQNVLHIGTHGFYLTDSASHHKEYFSKNVKSAIDPLNRCGLLFAGAQTAWSGHRADLPEGVQDGILTAKEISRLDLQGCDLLVLSACETAKGDITTEGVYGLQRAFKMAGVQTIIMSLWKVDDNATRLLMTEFYTNWIEKKQTKREAFKNAQNTVRVAVDEDGERMYENPYYWAGFIMLD